jgi:hypothetical protein
MKGSKEQTLEKKDFYYSVDSLLKCLSLVTTKFWLLNTLSQLQVYSGKVGAYWANSIISGTSSLWNRVIVFQRDGILSTGYFADLTIDFTKLRWKKQCTYVLKKYQFMQGNNQAWLPKLFKQMKGSKEKTLEKKDFYYSVDSLY